MQLELAVHQEGKLYEALTWMIEHRHGIAVETRGQHTDHRRWLVEYFGDVPVASIRFTEVHGYIEHEIARGIMRSTIKKRLTTLRLSLDDAYRRGKLPARTDWWPELQSDSRPGQDMWTYQQYRQGRLAFEPAQRIGIDILFWTGMHTSDVHRWRRGDVDMANRTWRRYNTKSKALPKWLPLPDEFAQLLEEWFSTEGICEPALRVAPQFWAFPSKAMIRICARAGLPHVTPLGFRRSVVAYIFEQAMRKGMTPEQAAEFAALWLGHKGDPRTSRIIRTHYMRWTPDAVDIANPFDTAPRPSLPSVLQK
jgi:integrase